MSSNLQIQSLTVEGFRGFRDRRIFQLDATAIIISGRNGTGKTSFFDALQWCLLGTIQRLESIRARRTEDYIVNAYRPGQAARVELELKNDTQTIAIRRVGNAANSFLTLQMMPPTARYMSERYRRESDPETNDTTPLEISGEDAERVLGEILLPGSSYELGSALLTTGLMEQDRLRAILEAKPRDQFAAMSDLVGLNRLQEFEAAVRDASDETAKNSTHMERDVIGAQRALEYSQGGLALLEERASRRPSVSTVLDAVNDLLTSTPAGTKISRPTQGDLPASLRSLAAWAAHATVQLSELYERAETLAVRERDLTPEPDAQTIQQVAARVEELKAKIRDLEATRDEVRRSLEAAQRAADEVSRLAALAIPLLSQSCPVCLQQINPTDVAESLQARAAGSEALASLHAILADSDRRVKVAEDQYRTVADEHTQLERLNRSWHSVRIERNIVNDLLRSIRGTDALADYSITIEDRHELLQRTPTVLEFLSRLRNEVLRGVMLLEDTSVEEELARSRADVANKQAQVEAAHSNAEVAKSRALEWTQLRDGVIRARVDVTRDRITNIEPLMADIFSRLGPHPTFKSISFELGDYYRQGTARTVVVDHLPDGSSLESNPLLVFSTSQANIAAVSAFLAMNLTASTRALPFVMLDDPVQSMDNVNVLAFSDLCRHLRRRRQLIVSTHFEPFGRLLARKLAPRHRDETARVLEFLGWDRSGPVVEERDLPYEVPADRRMYLRTAS